MNIDDIEKLYEEQDYKAALDAINDLMATATVNNDLKYLRVKCLFALLPAAQSESESADLTNEAYDACSEILDNEPSHKGALTYRAYIGTWSPHMEAYSSIAAEDCTNLLALDDDAARISHLEWRAQVYLRLEEPEKAVADLREIVTIVEEVYGDELPVRDEITARISYACAEILQHTIKDAPAALEQYRIAFEHGPYSFQYLPAAQLALELGDHDLTARIMEVLPLSLPEVTDSFAELLESIKQKAEENPAMPLIKTYCISTATFPEITMPAEDEDDLTIQQLSLGKKLMAQFPDVDYFPAYAGRTLFLAGQYADALPYLEKAVSMNALPTTVARWAYARYRVTGKFPEKMPEATDILPCNWYEAGVTCAEWEVTDEIAVAAREQLLLFLYGNAIRLFREYWFENNGTAYAHNRHYFAMCCNNYGISLANTGRHGEAIEIHTIGYKMSPFWEQINSRAYACRAVGQYQQAEEDWATVLEYSEYLDAATYCGIYHVLIDLCMDKLNDPQKALYWFDQFMEKYNNGLSDEIEGLPHDEREAAQAQVNLIITSRGLIAGEDLPQRIQLLEEHLGKFPDDTDAYFNLMQLYYENGQYEQCAGCATSRLSSGGLDQIPVASHAKIYYFRGRAYLLLGRYEQAHQDMLKTMELLQQDDTTSDIDYFMVHGYLGESSLGLNDNHTAIAQFSRLLEINDENNWTWDDTTARFAFLYATALKNDNQPKEAVRMLKRILEVMPDHAEAKQKLKEWKPKWSFF